MTQDPNKITAAEIRELFAALNDRVEALTAEVAQIKGGMTIASQPAQQTGTFTEMQIDTIVFSTDDNGKAQYKVKGAPYQKHGVRVWPETLPVLGIDPGILKPGPNIVSPITARVLMRTDEEGKSHPQKVIGRA